MAGNQQLLMSIASVLLKGAGMTGKKFKDYIEILLNGNVLKVSYHDIKYTDLSREEMNLFSVRTVNGVIQTMKLKNTPRKQEVNIELLIDAVLNANLPFKRVMNQLMDWMESCTNDTREELSSFLVYILSRSPEENVAFGNLTEVTRDFVLVHMDCLFHILPDLYYIPRYKYSLQIGKGYKTFKVVQENQQLFQDVFHNKVRRMPDPKPKDEDQEDDTSMSQEFKADSAEFPELEQRKVGEVAKASAPFIFEEVTKPAPAPVEVVTKPTVNPKDEILMVLDSDLPDELKVKVMQMLTSSV